jgi:hypothetical protein
MKMNINMDMDMNIDIVSRHQANFARLPEKISSLGSLKFTLRSQLSTVAVLYGEALVPYRGLYSVHYT